MRKSMMFLAALSVLVPATASAQTQKPDPFVIEDSSMMGRYARLPEDKVVPADAGGELTGVRGKGWWQVLGHCAGIYRFHHDEQADNGDTAGAATTEARGKYFIELAIRRLAADRNIDVKDTVEILIPEANYGMATAADGGETYRPFKVDEMRCAEVERVYKAGGLAR